jgi:multidrug efflux pump subunit AcrA (membrane-fusion protein)
MEQQFSGGPSNLSDPDPAARPIADPAARPIAEKPNSKPTRIRAAARPQPNKTRARIVQIVSVLILVLVLVVLWHFLGDRSAPKAAGTGRGEVVPVEAAAVTQQDVPLQIKAIGNVEPLSTIAVRSQVEGTLTRVAFVPGQEVKKGDLLFSIDSRPLQAALSEAEANLLKAMAAVRQGQDIARSRSS